MQTNMNRDKGQRNSPPILRGYARHSRLNSTPLLLLNMAIPVLLSALVLVSGSDIKQAGAVDELPASQIDIATTQRSDNGLYEVSYDSVEGPIVINTIHEWILTVVSTDGVPADGLTITVEGGMPMHDHGLPTAPRVTESLGEGQYRVEGMKFQMPGHWTTTFNLTNNDDISDSVTFSLVL